MSSLARALLPFAGFLLAPAFAVLADETVPQSRATISGTGKDVTIVYRGATDHTAKRNAAIRKLTGGPTASKPDLLDEAAKMAEKGADDQSLMNYFRTHQTELPDVVDDDAVRRLRKAGAGQAVVSYLSRLTAVDIGETAEGPAPQYAYAAPGEAQAGYGNEYPSANDGYPFYGGYGGYGFGGYGNGRLGRRGGGRPGFGFGFPGHSMRPSHPMVSPHPSMHAGGGFHGGGGAHVGGGMAGGGSHTGTFRH
jgi:hypothetical protein